MFVHSGAPARPRRGPTVVMMAAASVAMCWLLMVVGTARPAGAADFGDPTTVAELRSSADFRWHHGDVLRLYHAFFAREPDVEGAQYWITVHDAGASLDDLAWGFSNSKEFLAIYGPVDNRVFLEIVYSNVLGRTPDPAGFDYWYRQMEADLGRDGVVRWVAANDEFILRHDYSPTNLGLAPDWDAIANAAIGGVCGLEATTLVAGEHQGVAPGAGYLRLLRDTWMGEPALASFVSDDGPLTAVIATCASTGVDEGDNSGDVVLFFGPGARFHAGGPLDNWDLGVYGFTGATGRGFYRLTPAQDRMLVRSDAFMRFDNPCCASATIELEVKVEAGRVLIPRLRGFFTPQ